jgi:flagellar L-ring protein precursor FlgH
MRAIPMACLLMVCAAPLLAQRRPAADTTPAPPRVAPRASWLSDRRMFTVGDVLTILVDEQTAASERTGRNASSSRGQSAGLNAASGANPAIVDIGFQNSLSQTSDQTGASGREGRLSATLSVRVAQIAPDGGLAILGTREVTVDGRRQQMTLRGFVRPEDVSPQNVVLSSRIADAAITYRGNGIGPRRGILGGLVAFFWP